MAKCPKCGKVIHWLKTEAVIWSAHMLKFRCRLEKDGTYKEGFLCPVCGEVVVNSSREAEEFLRNGEVS